MSFTEIKKSPLVSLPFLKKRLRRITALGLRNLTVNGINFTVHFTLHRNDKTVAFYTSESVENQRSPEWSFLRYPASVQCLQDFVMRVWITSLDNCRLFLEYDVHLDDSLAPDEQKDDSHRNNNSLWLEMFGYRFTDTQSTLSTQKKLPVIDIETAINDRKFKRIHFVKSYNRLSILRMTNVLDAIRAEKKSSAQCLERLQASVDANEKYLSNIKERESRRLRIENLKQYLQSQRLIYEQRLNSNQQKQKIINEKKMRLEQNLLQLLNQQEEFNSCINHLDQSKCLLHDLTVLTTFRQKDIINEIYHYVYPIVKHDKNDYSIRDIQLPQAEDRIYQTSLTRERENEIGAAVGYCSHIVLIISQFIQLPLRFPIEYYGAPSIKIYDYTSQVRDFPLYPSYDINSFQYGFFLLNRNIGQIMYHCRVGGRHTDYRKTLENLKELMEQYFISPDHNDKQMQLYASKQQVIESTSPLNDSISEQSFMRDKRNSTGNSVFTPSRSAISSVIEPNEVEQINDNNNTNGIELFSSLNTLSPRLTMQSLHQPQQQ